MYWILGTAALFWVVRNRKGIWKGLQSPEGTSIPSCSFESEPMRPEELAEIKAYFEAKISSKSSGSTTHE